MDNVYVEKYCTFTHEGKAFEAGGAVVSPSFIIAYPAKDGVLQDWHGNAIGTWRSVASWRVNSWQGSHMHQIESIVNGVTYTGRGFGEGMIYRGRAKARRVARVA